MGYRINKGIKKNASHTNCYEKRFLKRLRYYLFLFLAFLAFLAFFLVFFLAFFAFLFVAIFSSLFKLNESK